MTVERAQRVVAASMDTWGIETLVDVMTVEFVMAENETSRTGTFVSTFGVYADVGAIVNFLTLVNVKAGFVVMAQHVASFACTTVPTNKIYADVGTVSIILHTFIHVYARQSILVQFKAIMT